MKWTETESETVTESWTESGTETERETGTGTETETGEGIETGTGTERETETEVESETENATENGTETEMDHSDVSNQTFFITERAIIVQGSSSYHMACWDTLKIFFLLSGDILRVRFIS